MTSKKAGRRGGIQEGGEDNTTRRAQGSLWPDRCTQTHEELGPLKKCRCNDYEGEGCNTQDHPRLRNKTRALLRENIQSWITIWIHSTKEEEPWELMVNIFSKAKVESGSQPSLRRLMAEILEADRNHGKSWPVPYLGKLADQKHGKEVWKR